MFLTSRLLIALSFDPTVSDWESAATMNRKKSFDASILSSTPGPSGAGVSALRRASYAPLLSLTSQQSLEPMIVVQESTCIDEEDETEEMTSPCVEGPARDSLLNPGLLYPYRDIRKRSLPTPQCTSGITASQVRRLSDQAGTTGTGAKEAAFLATLTQAPPAPGGRRHSVITISPAPPLLYGQNRRESIAAFPHSSQFRRDSSSSIARSPSGSITGSNFNLHRDIMDDIAEIKTPRKVRMKMWQTEDKEKVCEFQSVEGGGPADRYHQALAANSRDVAGPLRRYSDVSGIQAIGKQQTQSPPTTRRRASEAPANRVSTPPLPSSEIVISNTDLKTILSNLTSSAQEISNKMEKLDSLASSGGVGAKPSVLDQKRTLLKGSRSNSFDISMLPDGKKVEKEKSSWFQRRHLPMSNKTSSSSSTTEVVVTITDEKPRTSILKHSKTIDKGGGVTELKNPSLLRDKTVDKKDTPKHKVAWNKACGAMVDPHLLGSVIEGFLNKKTTETASTSKGGGGTNSGDGKDKKEDTNKENKEETTASSIVSTLKDLFVK